MTKTEMQQVLDAWPHGEPTWLPTCDESKALYDLECKAIAIMQAAVDAPAHPKGLFVDMIAEQGPAFVAEMAKIGCIQHDCDECKARAAQPSGLPFVPWSKEVDMRESWTQPAQPVQPDANQKLLQIIAAAYQIAGVYEAPDHVLDVLANPEAATRGEIDALLPFVAAQPKQEPLTQAQRSQVFDCAETSMRHNPNLSWRDAICDALESAHGIGEKT